VPSLSVSQIPKNGRTNGTDHSVMITESFGNTYLTIVHKLGFSKRIGAYCASSVIPKSPKKNF
jgi:hypothetical protein